MPLLHVRRTPRLLFLVLALAALLSWIAHDAGRWISADATSIHPIAASSRTASPAPSGRIPVEGELPTRAPLAPMQANPFSTPSWLVRTPAAAAKPAPVAPALPYRFVGRATLHGATQVFISSGERVLAVDKGDTLDGQYRVESVGRSEIAFLHLPSGIRQVMQLSPPLDDDRKDAAAPLAKAGINFSYADPVPFKTAITR
jgi:hypothetical protein